MAALAGAMPAFFEEGSSWEDYDDMAETCYQVADAMVRARRELPIRSRPKGKTNASRR